MTGEEFIKVWGDIGLRQYLVDICRAFTRNQTIQEDLLQEAWLRISLAPQDSTREYYMAEGFKAIDHAYHVEWRSWRLERWGRQHRALNERAKYREKKYKILKKTPKTRQ